MNSLERVLATIPGNDTDYQPFMMVNSLFGARLIKCDTFEYYHNPNLYFEGQKAVVEAFDPDLIITPFAFPLEAAAFGSELIFLPNYAPNVKKPIITDLSQIDSLPAIDYENSSIIQYFLKSTNLIYEAYNGQKALVSPIASPCDLPVLLMGTEMWIDTLLFHPKEVEKLMKKMVEHFVQFGNELLANGATILGIPNDFLNFKMVTKKMFETLYPYVEDAFGQIKGPIALHNGGYKVMTVIEQLAKLPNVAALFIENTESFDEARSIVGDKMVLMGNFNGPNFNNYSAERAKEITLKILNNRKNDKHFIFSTSNADIPYDTPVETIRTVVDTIRGFKKY